MAGALRLFVRLQNPARIGFNGVDDIWVDDVLNVGVDPRRLIGLLRDRFVAAGGAIYERTSFRSAEYAKDGISIRCGRASMVCHILSFHGAKPAKTWSRAQLAWLHD